MKLKTPAARVKTVAALLRRLYPRPRTALRYATPFQLLAAVILSAQCTDKKVNEVTEPIFAQYKTAADFASIPLPRLERMVKQTGFYRAKAKAIAVTARMVAQRFKNRVPLTMAELTTLRGVARKTANVVMGQLTGKAEGIAVDTHVIRLSNRLGLTKHADPRKIEADLMDIVPRKQWVTFSHLLILHGRAICEAKKPRCDRCVLSNVCPSASRFPHFDKASVR